MTIAQSYQDIDVSQIRSTAQKMKADGKRCVQVCCSMTDDGIDMLYSYRNLNGFAGIQNYVVHGLAKGDEVPSIQDVFPSLFPFENEAHDLFGINVTGMTYDFEGKFYNLAKDAPMTIVSPEQIKRKERAKKVAAALETKKRAARSAHGGDGSQKTPRSHAASSSSDTTPGKEA